MSDTPQPQTGDRLSVTVARKDGETVLREEAGYSCQLLGGLTLDEGEKRCLDVEVTKAIYSRSGSLRTLFVSPCDDSTSSHAGGKSETAETPTRSAATEKTAGGQSSAESVAGEPTASGPGSDPSSESASESRSTVRTRSPTDRRRNAGNGSNRSLKRIADELIGDEEFEETEDEDSMIEAAKRKARNQQRDPAIDPNLHES